MGLCLPLATGLAGWHGWLEKEARSGDAPSWAALRGGSCFVVPAKVGSVFGFAELHVLTLHYVFAQVSWD